MVSTVYKRLFEVRILHDYYLSENDSGASFFSLTIAQQQVRLLKLLHAARYNIMQDLTLMPEETTQLLMRNGRMKFLPTSMGFVIGLEVKVETDGGGTFYRPLVPMSDDERLAFRMSARNGSLAHFTNLPNWDSMPAQYFFSNENARLVGPANVLAQPAENFDPVKVYPMGALAESGGALREVYHRIQDGAQDLLDVHGDGFLSVQDKFLLPKVFEYRFGALTTGSARFTLSGTGGDEVKAIEHVSPVPFTRISLDFSKTAPPGPAPIADGSYVLKVELDGAIIEERNLLLSDGYHSPAQMGLLEFRPATSDAQFGLLDDEGRLHTRILPDGTKLPHPVFELRLLSRRTFWRYRRPVGYTAADTAISDQFVLVGDKLVTKKPMPLTRALRLFPSLSGANMPNPKPDLLRAEGKWLFNDVYVSAVNRLE